MIDTDYAIIGAGSAGCVVANRLSATGARVLLVEAGPRDISPLIHVPAGVAMLMGHRLYDWKFESEREPRAGGRTFRLPRGRGLGGTSSINGMNFIRGLPEDYDGWAQMGCRGWSYADVLPHFKSIESFAGGDDAYRGRSGPLAVETYRTILPITHRFVEAAQQAGFTLMDDLNGATREGVGYSQMSRRGRWRASAATAFLKPAEARSNLRVMTGAHVMRLLFDGRRCTGFAIRRDGEDDTVRVARAVVLSAGSVGSPHLLQLSGIGPAAHLRALGIDVVRDLPGVGRNLSDHYAVPVSVRIAGLLTVNQMKRGPRLAWEMLRWLVAGNGALTFGVTAASVFCRSRPELAAPDIQMLFFPGSFRPDNIREMEHEPGARLSVSLARPRSRGSIMARSADIREPPAIALNYLADRDDIAVLSAGIGIARRMFAAPALRPYVVRETQPGADAVSPQALEDHVRATGSTVHHLAGTCRMGEDAEAVVDSRLRLHGIEGLRVIDASVMPVVTSSNINAPTLMIGEKGARMLIEDGG